MRAVLFLCFSTALFSAELLDETKATTLFAFDDVAIPHTQNLRLEMRQPVGFEGNPVVKRGEPGTPDAQGEKFYGSIIQDGGKYRVWYVAFDDDVKSKVASARWMSVLDVRGDPP